MDAQTSNSRTLSEASEQCITGKACPLFVAKEINGGKYSTRLLKRCKKSIKNRNAWPDYGIYICPERPGTSYTYSIFFLILFYFILFLLLTVGSRTMIKIQEEEEVEDEERFFSAYAVSGGIVIFGIIGFVFVKRLRKDQRDDDKYYPLPSV